MENIKKEINELRATLRYHSDRYYNDDAPEIEDYEYDMMMRRLKELEEKYGALGIELSVDYTVDNCKED